MISRKVSALSFETIPTLSFLTSKPEIFAPALVITNTSTPPVPVREESLPPNITFSLLLPKLLGSGINLDISRSDDCEILPASDIYTETRLS